MTEDHETWRPTREAAIGLAVLRAAMGSADVTIHHETCVGTPECTCEPVIVHLNHRPDDEHEGSGE